MFLASWYAIGHYVPAISNKIVEENQSNNAGINFQGCAIGNGLVDPRAQYPQYANFSYINKLISKFDFDKYAVEIKPCQAALAAGLYTVAYGLCNGVMQGILSASGIQNVYNIKAGCPGNEKCLLENL
jgi:carboxypeptidase C (cathepsin A)